MSAMDNVLLNEWRKPAECNATLQQACDRGGQGGFFLKLILIQVHINMHVHVYVFYSCNPMNMEICIFYMKTQMSVDII